MTVNKKTVPTNAGRFSGAVEFSEETTTSGDSSSSVRRFTVTPYNGQQFSHWYWGKMAFDAKGISMRKSVIPAFKDHDSAKLVGEIDSISVDGGAIELSGDFLDTPDAQLIQSTKKIEWECSLAFDLSGAKIEEVEEDSVVDVNGQSFAGPGTIIREAELYETSFTHFGAVPGTETAFSKSGDTVEIVTFKEDKEMSEVDLTAIKSEGRSESLSVFKAMNTLCDDKAFVAECFEKGVTLEQFQAQLLEKFKADIATLTAEKAELASKLEAAKDVATTFHASDNGSDDEGDNSDEDLDFRAKASKLSKDEKISLGEAFSKLAKSEPDLYAEFKASCRVTA